MAVLDSMVPMEYMLAQVFSPETLTAVKTPVPVPEVTV